MKLKLDSLVSMNMNIMYSLFLMLKNVFFSLLIKCL